MLAAARIAAHLSMPRWLNAKLKTREFLDEYSATVGTLGTPPAIQAAA